MEEVKKLVDTVLKNKSLTIFLAIVIVAMFFGWIGG
jgi:multidrug efflux pump subunit AcrB